MVNDVNYDKEMQKIISSLDKVPRLMLHTCCAPCSSAVIERLKEYFDITVLYYNPNIEPMEEYEKRKNEQKKFLNAISSDNVLDMIDADYDNEHYKAIVEGHENDVERGPRCRICYEDRIRYTFLKAQELGYDYFGTTLSVSPHKVSSWINEIGLSYETDEVKFLVADFKKQNGYKRSIELSSKYDLYRQDYCGCVYSKKARELEKEKKLAKE